MWQNKVPVLSFDFGCTRGSPLFLATKVSKSLNEAVTIPDGSMRGIFHQLNIHRCLRAGVLSHNVPIRSCVPSLSQSYTAKCITRAVSPPENLAASISNLAQFGDKSFITTFVFQTVLPCTSNQRNMSQSCQGLSERFRRHL